MANATFTMDNETFVLVPQREYAELTAELPDISPANADGTFPALPAIRVSIARSIIKDRLAAGMTQKAGVGTADCFRPPLPPNRTGGSPASGVRRSLRRQ